MATPYKTPLTENPGNETEAQTKLRFWNRFVRWSIYGIVLPLLFGVSGTVIGMLGAFKELSNTSGARSEELASAISTSMRATMFGLSVAAIATICLIISLKKRNALKRFQL